MSIALKARINELNERVEKLESARVILVDAIARLEVRIVQLEQKKQPGKPSARE